MTEFLVFVSEFFINSASIAEVITSYIVGSFLVHCQSNHFIFLWDSCKMQDLGVSIVNRGDWLWSRAKIEGANKAAKISVGRSITLHSLLFCTHTICISYVTNKYLLVNSSVNTVNNYCVLHTVKAQLEKKMQQRTFSSFITISLYYLWCVLSQTYQ